MENNTNQKINRWLYVSQPAKNVNFNQIQEILTISHRNNSERNISGALIYDHKHFIQYLEGDKNIIDSLREKIQSNPNHHEIHTIAFGEIPQRHFKNWTMSYISYAMYNQVIPNLCPEGFRPYETDEKKLLEIIKSIQMVA